MSLPPGEHVVKESGRMPVAYAKGAFRTINGKLILTNQRLIFTAGRFQSVVEAVVGGHKERVELRLPSITRVEKGFGATIKVHADKEYTFKGMRKADEWVSAINQARAEAARPREEEITEARRIRKYTQRPSGEIVELGPIQLEQALHDIERLEVASISGDGISVPMLGFQDEDRAILEFNNVDGIEWNVRVDGYKGDSFLSDVSLKEAKMFAEDFFQERELRLRAGLKG